MTLVPTLHLRNVPSKVYEALRARAAGSGRSLNAEVVAILREEVDRRQNQEDLLAELERLSVVLPEGAPTPEQLVREDRDAR